MPPTHPVTSGSLIINLITKQITTIKKTLYSINRKTVSKLSNKKYIRYLLCDNVICDDKSLGSVTRYTRAKAVHSTMSEKELARREAELSDIRVEAVRNQQRRNTHAAVPTVDSAYEGRTKGLPKVSSRSNEFVYVNRAYVGSLNSVNEPRGAHEPITGVYREQYWACSKWSFAKKGLAIAVGVLLGGVIGLAVTLIIKEKSAEEIIGGIFMASAPD